jgi:26S proteasome regulatory subunit N1
MKMSEEWKNETDKERKSKLLGIVRDIVKHNMRHNAEVEACDLLTEIEQLYLLLEFVEEVNHGRVCLYLLRLVFWEILFLKIKKSNFMALKIRRINF